MMLLGYEAGIECHDGHSDVGPSELSVSGVGAPGSVSHQRSGSVSSVAKRRTDSPTLREVHSVAPTSDHRAAVSVARRAAVGSTPT